MDATSTQQSKGQSARVDMLGVRKSYGSHVALENLDLQIAPGEFLSLLGPSGCGKTTLLRCIAGLVRPEAGDIRVDGQSLVPLPPYKRNLGMVFQSYALFPHMTVEQNIAFGLSERGTPAGKARVQNALELVRMQGYGSHLPRQISGGQQQRIALARALVTSPRILLLDEPLAALDAKLRESMQVELRQLQRRLGITTIFVTHDQREALTMSDRVAVMHKGRIEQCASPEEIYARPASAVVANFIGQTSQIPATVVAHENDRLLLRVDDRDLTFAVPRHASLPLRARVLVMIRPEHVVFNPGAPGDGTRSEEPGVLQLNGEVAEDVFIGERRLLHVATAAGQILAGKRSIGGADRLPPGTTGAIQCRLADMMVFAV
ncbi:MAG: ABC transporter ATP-binding protein [Hyphomicrobiaceae bacterium]